MNEPTRYLPNQVPCSVTGFAPGDRAMGQVNVVRIQSGDANMTAMG